MTNAGSSSQVAFISEDLCVVCGGCEMVCPTKAITIKRVGVVDPAKCTGCAECVNFCPTEAISLKDRS